MGNHPEENSKHSEDTSRHSEENSRHPESRFRVRQTAVQNVQVDGDLTIGKVIQIGSQIVQQLPLRQVLLVLFVVIASSGVVLLYLKILNSGPSKMPSGTFNVAVADFGEEDKDKGVRKSEAGEMLSESIYGTLINEKSDVENQDLTIWQDNEQKPRTEKGVDISYIRGNSEEEQEQNARTKAEEINADVLIYGNINSNSELTPKFVVSSRFEGPELMLGSYKLGKLQVDKSNPIYQQPELTKRTTLLFWLIEGLVGLSSDDIKAAKERFEIASEKWKDVRGEKEGREIVYFFIGMSELFSTDEDAPKEDFDQYIDKARKVFTKAIKINPDYIRAQIGLGDIYIMQANRRLAEHTHDGRPLCEGIPCTKEIIQGFIDPAIKEYKKASGIAKIDPGSMSWSNSPIYSLGIAYTLKGEAYLRSNNNSEANKSFAIAIDHMKTIPDIFLRDRETRLLGQTYLALGNAYRGRAFAVSTRDRKRSKELLKESIRHFKSCIALDQKLKNELPNDKNKLPEDNIFSNQIVELCKNGESYANEELKQ